MSEHRKDNQGGSPVDVEKCFDLAAAKIGGAIPRVGPSSESSAHKTLATLAKSLVHEYQCVLGNRDPVNSLASVVIHDVELSEFEALRPMADREYHLALNDSTNSQTGNEIRTAHESWQSLWKCIQDLRYNSDSLLQSFKKPTQESIAGMLNPIGDQVLHYTKRLDANFKELPSLLDDYEYPPQALDESDQAKATGRSTTPLDDSEKTVEPTVSPASPDTRKKKQKKRRLNRHANKCIDLYMAYQKSGDPQTMKWVVEEYASENEGVSVPGTLRILNDNSGHRKD